ncbi:Tomoregulin-2 [Triplophysa tibetana]|uniref:Tomoregulin-2 n=1 Tax=Triplophysa tibetana TaxID=1572043 RepID=A0A5A9NTG6_9TELE|nr:Tomoregulin-2 [Triplophysa tibetana]
MKRKTLPRNTLSVPFSCLAVWQIRSSARSSRHRACLYGLAVANPRRRKSVYPPLSFIITIIIIRILTVRHQPRETLSHRARVGSELNTLNIFLRWIRHSCLDVYSSALSSSTLSLCNRTLPLQDKVRWHRHPSARIQGDDRRIVRKMCIIAPRLRSASPALNVGSNLSVRVCALRPVSFPTAAGDLDRCGFDNDLLPSLRIAIERTLRVPVFAERLSNTHRVELLRACSLPSHLKSPDKISRECDLSGCTRQTEALFPPSVLMGSCRMRPYGAETELVSRGLWVGPPQVCRSLHVYMNSLRCCRPAQNLSPLRDIYPTLLTEVWFEEQETDLFLCDTNTCKFDGECLRIGDTVTCICDFKAISQQFHVCCCSGDYAPMCGSNGESYENHCLLRKEACKLQTEVLVVSEGTCPVDAGSGSGDDGVCATSIAPTSVLIQFAHQTAVPMTTLASCHSGFIGPQCDTKDYNVMYVVPGSGKLRYVLIASIIGALQVAIICLVVLCITRTGTNINIHLLFTEGVHVGIGRHVRSKAFHTSTLKTPCGPPRDSSDEPSNLE